MHCEILHHLSSLIVVYSTVVQLIPANADSLFNCRTPTSLFSLCLPEYLEGTLKPINWHHSNTHARIMNYHLSIPTAAKGSKVEGRENAGRSVGQPWKRQKEGKLWINNQNHRITTLNAMSQFPRVQSFSKCTNWYETSISACGALSSIRSNKIVWSFNQLSLRVSFRELY